MASPVRMLCFSVCVQPSDTPAGGSARRRELKGEESGGKNGRAAPPMKGMLRRRGEREEMARRIVMLSSEMDRGIESWLEREEEAQRIEERQKSLLLKPKGKLLKKKDAHS
ncbi:39S ribosomal protein L52, mitochondrial isoform X3 [Syngnathus acus]|uniref:39S ribosomal protein L52, mitochondrial isoform X3 n=1 Tax=Syngnathus acus TaxID=161584 RepID=UPI001885D5FB|nr:39S ribosomal protein L52, mitochondrial isoform X3 [Syngnathus acus]